MLKINRFFFAIIQLVLFIDSTKQSYAKQAITAVKTVGSTMKKSMTMLRQNKNTIKNIAYGVQKKYLQTKHSFASKSVKHLGVEAIKKFKHTAPQAARGGKQLFSLESKKNIQMRSGSQINGKDLGFVIKRSAEFMRGKELSSLINMVSKSKSYLPFLAGGGLMRLTEMGVITNESNFSTDDLSLRIPQGKLELNNGMIYEGGIKNDNFHGKGKIFNKDGTLNYEGNFIDGAPISACGEDDDGQTDGESEHLQKIPEMEDIKLKPKGKLILEDGSVYEGDVVYNKMHGKGKLTTYDDENVSDTYEGTFVDGKLQGKGTLKFQTTHIFEGMFKDGKVQNGKGKLTYPDEGSGCDIYEGEMKQPEKTEWDFAKTLPNGEGCQTCYNGYIFTGKFVDGKIQGHGTFTDVKSERYYEGNFIDGQIEGEGTMQYQSRDVYTGNFRCNKKDGFGKILYHDGDIYKGEWQQSMFHGKGEFYSKEENTTTKGIFEDGHCEEEGAVIDEGNTILEDQ